MPARPTHALSLLLIAMALGAVLTSCARPSTERPTPTGSITAAPTLAPPTPGEDSGAAARRERMVIDTIVRRGVTDEHVLQAMRLVPRHLFVPDADRDHAYGDYPLPIGYGQTISQPYIVALMTELLGLESGDRVLEVGTGSGYQAAVLGEIPGVEVYTIEIIPQLAERARSLLDNQGYGHVHSRQADGYYGWAEHGPYDAIIVTAAPDHVPQPLIDQLAPEGALVIPVGPPGGYQTLWRFVKQASGEMKAYNEGGVAFVPFTGQGLQEAPDGALSP